MEPFFVKETREGFNSKRLVFINSLKLLRCGLGEGAFEGYTLCQSPPSLKQNRIVFWCEGAAVHLLEGYSMHKFLLAHTSPFKTQDWRESLLLGNKLRWASVSFCPILVGRWCKERKEKEVYCLWWRGSCEYFIIVVVIIFWCTLLESPIIDLPSKIKPKPICSHLQIPT